MKKSRIILTRQEALKQSKELTQKELSYLQMYLTENYQKVSQKTEFDDLSDFRFGVIKNHSIKSVITIFISLNRLRRFIVTGQDINKREKTNYMKYLKNQQKN